VFRTFVFTVKLPDLISMQYVVTMTITFPNDN